MDFHLSYEWLNACVAVRCPPEELAERLSLHSVSVERIRRLDEGLGRIVVGRVVRVESHPNADKLRVVYVATRSRTPLARVVCGGTNLREGMHVAYAMPGARVRWHGEGNPIELQPAEVRGVRSDGMICAASEIGLAEYFPVEGEREILDCSFIDVTSGTAFATALGLDDVVFDVEVTTNRPDLMSVVGLAREVAAITGATLRSSMGGVALHGRPLVGLGASVLASVRDRPRLAPTLHVRIADRRSCPRYTATVLGGVTVGPSPWWMRHRLIAAGMRPIHNVVDVTNYVLLELGQPLHAFDAARCTPRSQGGVGIVVRRAGAGESLHALNGETYVLRTDDLVIADVERPIAIAGIIGGAESGVTAGTASIILEAATFDPMTVRRTWRSHGIRTESAMRYEKGLQPEGVDVARARAIALLREVSGASVIGDPVVAGSPLHPMRPIAFDLHRASGTIGVPLPAADAKRMLTALGCRVAGSGARWRVTPPWWRRGDLEASHDLVEELARLHGYHRIPSVLPTGALPASVMPPELPTTAFGWEDRVREILVGYGATELLTHSLTSRTTVERCGYTMDQCVVVENPLSEEYSLLRPALLPTMLPVIAQNEGEMPNELLFEVGRAYVPQPSTVRGRITLPREEPRLLIAAYGRMVSGAHVVQLKGIVERLFDRLGVRDITFHPSGSCVLPSGTCLWHPGRTMDVILGATLVGVLGEVHPVVVERFGINQRVAAAELDWTPILAACGSDRAAAPPPVFPAVKRDLAIAIDRTTSYADIAAVLDRFDAHLTAFELFDTYEGAGVPLGEKSMAFHLTWSAPDRTLTTVEVDALTQRLVAALRERFGAAVRE